MQKSDIQKKIKDFLIARFELDFGKDPDLNDDTHLYDQGYIDSLESLVLLQFLEKTFGLSIGTQDLMEDPINTVHEMVDFVSKRKS